MKSKARNFILAIILCTTAVFGLSLMFQQVAYAVPIFEEDFETDGNGSRYSVTEECTDSSGDFFTRSDGTNIGSFVVYNSPSNSWYWWMSRP